MRSLAWRLDSLGVDIIVVPGMTDIAGPRLKLRPIDNMPLFHIARPRRDGASMYGKRAFDLIFGTVAMVVVCGRPSARCSSATAPTDLSRVAR
jgi:hypothetical protein